MNSDEFEPLKPSNSGADGKKTHPPSYGALIEDTDVGSVSTLSASFAIDPEAEQRLVRKFDLRILPCLAFMYLFNSLDKSNLGNAKTAGLEKTLGFRGNQFNLIVSVSRS